MVKGLLQKSRKKRWSLTQVLDNPWFADDKSIHKARKEASKSPDRSKFQAYTMTSTDTKQID